MNVIVVWTNVTHRPPAAEIIKEGTNALASRATNTYKATTSIVKVSDQPTDRPI